MPHQPEVSTAAPAAEREARPFLKWVGGKSRLLEQFQPLLPGPGSYGTYFEPFLGSGALFFFLRPSAAVLSDVNGEIIDCYRAVKTKTEDVIRELSKHKYDDAHYYAVRAGKPRTLAAAAARTLYLNKTGYNGLYRVNRAGGFNVPMGRYKNPGFQSEALFANLRVCCEVLQQAEIASADFEVTSMRARPGDFVYLDPPYVPVSATSDFTSYARGGFPWSEQERLTQMCKKLWRRGVKIMLSNSDTESVRELYKDFRVDVVLAARSINSQGSKRGKVCEVVARNFVDGKLLPPP
jgi:DNA adenine methylase